MWRATRGAIVEGERSAAAAHLRGVSLYTLRPVTSRFEAVLGAAEFRSGAEFEGDTYVSSESELDRYSEGRLEHRWRAGRDFPATRLSTLAVRSGIGNPELWIATDGAGVLIYDGTLFRQLVAEDAKLRAVTAMLPFANGQVLLGTRAGLYISDGKSLREFHAEFAKTEVTALTGDEDQLWIGTRTDGAWYWRGGEARHITAELPDGQVLSLAANGETAWVGTPLGVSEFQSGNLSRHLAEGLFAQAIAEEDGKLWVGTADQGAFEIPLDVKKARPQLAGRVDETAAIASFARIGRELTAVEADGVVDLSSGRTILSAPENRLGSGHITAIHEDSRGRLWIGYFDRGIDSIPASGAPVHREDDTLFCINRIKENPQDGSVLVATANGLAIFDSGAKLRQVLTRESGLISSNVTDVLFSDSGLAVATPAGLSFVDHGAISSIYAFQGLVNNHVFTLADWNGALYAGTLGGISSMRRGLVQASFNTANSALRQNWITASASFGGHLYLGTYGAGVIRFDGGGEIQSFRAFAGHRCEINPNALLATDRALYAGTAGRGLAILRANDAQWQFVTDGLPSLNVTALAERDGRVYIGTDNGLVQISENNLLP